MESIQKFTLCHACGACPEIAIYGQEVHIGEKGNLVRLNRQEWNELVRKIRVGELKEI